MGYAHKHRWTNPSLRHTPISGERYIAPEFMEREWDHIWTKVWLLVTRAPDIPNSGDYTLEEIGAESFITMRQDDCLLYTSPSPRDKRQSRMPSSA